VTVAESLSALLPADACTAQPDDRDATRPGIRPECTVHPGSTEEVASIMSWASGAGVGVLPIGSGRWADPVLRADRYIVLSTERLAGIETYEPDDLTVTARSGTLFSTVDAALREHGQWTPFDPPHVDERSLGGLVAAGESGPLWMGYGELRNHVLGMTVVTGDGRVLELGGRVVKNVAGFDLVKPMVGSVGSLAVITAVCVRAFPMPIVERVLTLRAESAAQLVGYAQAVGTAPVMPVSSVLVDGMDGPGGGAALVLRLHGAIPTVDADQVALEAHVGVEFEVVRDPTGWLSTVRDHGAEAPVVLVASALPSRLAEVLSVLDGLERSTLVVDTYGARIGVGLSSVSAESLRAIRGSVERLGGALHVRRLRDVDSWDDLSSGVSADQTDLTTRLREVFDPAGVLWPARRMGR